MSTKKAPTEKRIEGAIYRFEKAEEKKAAQALLDKCKKQCKRVLHLIKDSHKGIYVKHYQTIN